MTTTSFQEEEETPGLPVHRWKAIWGQGKKMAICNPGRVLSPETSSPFTLIMGFQPSELWENKFLCWSHLLCGMLLGQPEQTSKNTIERLLLLSTLYSQEWVFEKWNNFVHSYWGDGKAYLEPRFVLLLESWFYFTNLPLWYRQLCVVG